MSKELKDVAARPVNVLHESFTKWAKKEAGVSLNAEDVALVLRLHPHFRKTDEYESTRDKLREARASKANEAQARVAERTRTRLAKLDEQRAALEAKLAGKPAPKVKATAPKASKPKADAKVTAITDARPARSRRGKPSAPAVDEDDPF